VRLFYRYLLSFTWPWVLHGRMHVTCWHDLGYQSYYNSVRWVYPVYSPCRLYDLEYNMFITGSESIACFALSFTWSWVQYFMTDSKSIPCTSLILHMRECDSIACIHRGVCVTCPQYDDNSRWVYPMYAPCRFHGLKYNMIITLSESIPCIPLVVYITLTTIWL